MIKKGETIDKVWLLSGGDNEWRLKLCLNDRTRGLLAKSDNIIVSGAMKTQGMPKQTLVRQLNDISAINLTKEMALNRAE